MIFSWWLDRLIWLKFMQRGLNSKSTNTLMNLNITDFFQRILITYNEDITLAFAVCFTSNQLEWSDQIIRWISGVEVPTSTISLILKDVVRHLWDIVFAYETSQLLAVETNKQQPWCLKPAASRVGAKCLLTLKKFCFLSCWHVKYSRGK